MASRVLVIEDNPADFLLLREALVDINAIGIRLTHVETLGDALKQMEAESFDVALLDLSLPDTDGLDGLIRLRKASPELPILVLTGRNDEELAVRAVREGAQDYLLKGQVSGDVLVRAMRYAEERMRGTQQLKRSEERFRALLRNALDIITVLDANGAISYASPSVQRVLGYAPEELVGGNVADLIHPADLARVLEALRNLRAGEAATIECRVRTRTGEWRVLEAVSSGATPDPHLSGIVVNARDVTLRKEAEARLREANHRLQAVIQTSPLTIVTLDLSGRVLSWNKAAENTFGWTESKVFNRELPIVQAQFRARFKDRLREVAEGRSYAQVEARLVCKDGSLIEGHLWASPLRDHESEITGVVAVVADVTEHRRLEDQFRQAQKMEAVGRLAGGVAHDFNNLLTIIIGYSQLASKRVAPESLASSDLSEVLQAADRAAALTKQLLTLSRRQIVEPALLDLNQVVAGMERMLLPSLGEDVQLVTFLSPALREVRADRGQFELVLLNLAINARDAMPQGGRLIVETENIDLDDSEARNVTGMSGRCVMLAVSDTGTGMEAEVRAHIFEPFFTTKEPGKGTGLGLSTSYGIVRQHGGDIWVYSEPGLGTTFKVYLPAAETHTETRTAPTHPAAAIRGTETILLVEDDPSVAGVIRQALGSHGYQVLMASEADEALDIVSNYREPIHLLLSDMVLRKGHGVDLARQIRKLRSEIRVLFVSGYTGPAMPGNLFRDPGSAFLQKPFTPEALASKVREVLNGESGSEPTPWTESQPGLPASNTRE